MKINFDFFYELNHGSVISHTCHNTKKFWRMKDGELETMIFVDEIKKFDWQRTEMMYFLTDGVFKLEERFQKKGIN